MAEAFPASGNIDPTTFPFLLMDLHRRGATGSLKVEGPSHPKALYFRGGRILFGSSNDPKDQLGSILIEQARITQEQLEDVNAKVGPGNPLAKVLAESGYVNQRELGDAARIKVERILSDVIAYGSGSFEFEDGVLPKGAVDLKLSTEKLVLGSVARISDRAFVLRHIDGLGVVLAPTPEAQERIGEVRAEVTPLLERLDGRRSLKDAVALTRLDEFEAAKLACGLLFLGVVRRAEAGGAGVARESEELDLAAAAQEALGDEPDGFSLSAPAAAPPAPARSAPDIPFFVPEDQPLPAAPGSVEADEVAFPMVEPSGFGPGDDTPAFASTPAVAVPQPEGAPDVGAFGDGPSVPPFAVPAEPEPIVREDRAATTAPPEADAAGGPLQFSTAEPEPSFGSAPIFEAPPSFDIPKLDLAGAPQRSAPVDESFDMDTLPRGVPTASETLPSFHLDASPSPAHHEDEEGPMTTPSAPPSKEDLAALDELLNPSASSIGRAQPPSMRPDRDRWEPQFRPTVGRRPAPRGRGVPILPLALGVAGLAVAGAAGYYFLVLRPAQAAPVAKTSPSTQPAPSIATLAGAPVEGAPSSSAQGPSAAPPAAATFAPATLAPVTVATPRPSTTLPQPPTTTPVASGPAAASGDARGLLRAGGYAGAARAFATELQGGARGRYTVQLLVACSEETVQKAVSAVPAGELFILPVNYKGKSCYRLCWGVYRNEPEAASAGSSLPDYFRRGGATPKVSPIADLLP
jgi:hypothetical protein